jgi:hypothetical protein
MGYRKMLKGIPPFGYSHFSLLYWKATESEIKGVFYLNLAFFSPVLSSLARLPSSAGQKPGSQAKGPSLQEEHSSNQASASSVLPVLWDYSCFFPIIR